MLAVGTKADARPFGVAEARRSRIAQRRHGREP
jgi:hypothetical protein